MFTVTLRSCAAALIAVLFANVSLRAEFASRSGPPTDASGSPLLDAQGRQILYGPQPKQQKVAADRAKAGAAEAPLATAAFVPPSGNPQRPFWQHSLFGSGIGASNIVVVPGATGQPPEIVLGGNSTNNFGGDDFWHVLRWNATSATYETVFASPLYNATVRRLAVGNVRGDAALEIVVMLTDGRIYLYDFASKAALGHITTSVTSLEGLALADLDGDGRAELAVTNTENLYVFTGEGALAWQVPTAGGYDVVIGQMDNDAALEIATTKGHVVDVVTRTIQWTRTTGFGRFLRLAPFPGENYSQLIAAESWYNIFAYDVARELPRWSLTLERDIGAIEIADVEGDGVPELVVGENQWGAVRVFDLMNNRALKWSVTNPEHGVTNVAIADLDADGALDITWGSGWSSTGADYLYVANTTGTRNIKWQSLDLSGLLGPVIGDLDGDGQPELVVCSVSSDSGYKGGRILVFNAATNRLRAASAVIGGATSGRLLTDIKLRDIDNDGVLEIAVSGSTFSAGFAHIIGFSATNTFTTRWASGPGQSNAFNFIEVADLDGNGTQEILTTYQNYLYIYDYPATTNPWQSLALGSNAAGLVVQDLDGNGSKEIAVLNSAARELYTFDGPTRQLRNLRQSTGFTTIAGRRNPVGLVGATSAGVGQFLTYANNSYSEAFTRQLASGPIDGINVSPTGALWTGAAGVLHLRHSPSYSAMAWQSPESGATFGRGVATDFRNDQNRVYSAARHALFGYTYSPGQAAALTGAVSRKTHGTAGVFDVPLPLTGSGVECRSGGPDGIHTLVFTFNMAVVSGDAAVTSGSGAVTTQPVCNGDQMIVTLEGVAHGEPVTVSLTNVVGAGAPETGSASLTFGVLEGDVNGNRAVNATDIAIVKASAGQTVNGSNFRADGNTSGTINASDVGLVKARTGSALPQ